jgi:hypothetical protein
MGGRVGGAFGGTPYVAPPQTTSGWFWFWFLVVLFVVEKIATLLPR